MNSSLGVGDIKDKHCSLYQKILIMNSSRVIFHQFYSTLRMWSTALPSKSITFCYCSLRHEEYFAIIFEFSGQQFCCPGTSADGRINSAGCAELLKV